MSPTRSTLPVLTLLFLGGCAGNLDGQRNGSAGGPAAPPVVYPPAPPPPPPAGATPPATQPPAPAPPPPEVEQLQDFEVPRGGARFVYVSNRRRDSVSVIDSTGLGIRTVPVGDSPGYLTTVPGQDIALVVNAGTRDASILRTDGAGASTVSRVPIVAAANRISVARAGDHAVAWYDSAAAGPGGPAAGGGFQEVTLITLAPGADKAVDMTVGFRPSEVVFADDGRGAFVVTEDGISILRFADITGPTVAPFVRFPDAGPTAPAALDVSVTPDGRYAIARREGASQVMLLDLTAAPGAASAVTSVDLVSPVTDLDLAPGGAFAIAVLRAENAYVRLAIPGGFAAGVAPVKRVLAGEAIGSAALSADGATAVLYTTVGSPPVERIVVARLDTAAAAPSLPVTLKKSVRAVAIAPDGKTAIVLHNKAPGDITQAGIDVETRIDRSYGYTIVNLASGFAKLQITEGEVSAQALTPDGGRAFVLVRASRLVQRIALSSFIVDEFPLGSPPTSLAVLGAAVKRVFVSQEHPEGRISFIDWDTGMVESVTGFELNGRIVQ
jgi:YVTN family beta-propeller protein